MTDDAKSTETATPSTDDAAKAPPKPRAKRTTKKTAKKTAKKTTKKKVAKKKTTKKVAKKTTKKTTKAASTKVVPEKAPVEPTEKVPEKTTKKTTKKTTRKTTKKAPARKPRVISKPEPVADIKPTDGLADMLINYVPGEECRIAIVENGQLEEFSSEPTNQVSRVGNIYIGRVTNIETAIQAAFVDFGIEENGFLHISDLHPSYFPGADGDSEDIGRKVPRKSRPPMQQCLRKGQEIAVQVLKEGVGTKGPTLTGYLSIPGRFLVMMPGMDKVGVSRKEEDDDKRRKAKQILSQLDLPDGFGFILRTAGFDRTKSELKRDLSYLHRLWKDMEKRRKTGNKPRLLYSESDLLVRSIRDQISSDIGRVIIDNESALHRAARFIKIVSPRTHAKFIHYSGTRPLFHAFGIEQQIKQIHAREVPLPSGGRLVIDQTEALVAVDVNSGKSRRAKDAETNAYQTNLEAVDVICRQLRLRDLGGLVISDLIDMRLLKHRRDIENRFKERLKRDRARSTILPISAFGILEMTRQRMRGSQESIHFADCPTCHGRGLLQRPGSIAAEALRDLAALMESNRVHRAELVVHPRVAGALLSARRQSLTRVELGTGKHIDVRISETLPPNRVAFYAYDEAGADIDLERLPRNNSRPSLIPFDLGVTPDDESWAVDMNAESEETSTANLVEHLSAAANAHEKAASELDPSIDVDAPIEEDADAPRKKRRRRRRGGRGRSSENETSTQAPNASDGVPAQIENADSEPVPEQEPAGDSAEPRLDENGEPIKKKRRRRRRGGRGRSGNNSEQGENTASDPSPEREQGDDAGDTQQSQPSRKTRSRKRSSSKQESPPEPVVETKPAKPKRRGLYAGGRRKLSSSEVTHIEKD